MTVTKIGIIGASGYTGLELIKVLVNHPYFESNELELRIKFKNQKDLKNEIEILKKSLEDGRIEKLLKLIKEGI